jgi:hypothetical protein
LLILITVGFTLAYLLLIALVAVPVPRYTDAAGVFLPTVPAVALCELWAKIRARSIPHG